MSDPRTPILDKVGACASAFCAVHCVLTGVALGLLSSLGLGFFGHPVVEIGFFAVAIVVGIFALRHGVRSHKSFVPALFFIVGLASFGAAHLVADGGHTGVVATALNVTGGTSLVLFHVLNMRLQKARTCCGEGRICTHGTKKNEGAV